MNKAFAYHLLNFLKSLRVSYPLLNLHIFCSINFKISIIETPIFITLDFEIRPKQVSKEAIFSMCFKM